MLASVTMSSVYLSSNISSHLTEHFNVFQQVYIYIYISSLTTIFFRFLYKSVHFYYRNGIIFPYIYSVFHHLRKQSLYPCVCWRMASSLVLYIGAIVDRWWFRCRCNYSRSDQGEPHWQGPANTYRLRGFTFFFTICIINITLNSLQSQLKTDGLSIRHNSHKPLRLPIKLCLSITEIFSITKRPDCRKILF